MDNCTSLYGSRRLNLGLIDGSLDGLQIGFSEGSRVCNLRTQLTEPPGFRFQLKFPAEQPCSYESAEMCLIFN